MTAIPHHHAGDLARIAELERELADCRRTCAELVTDGNAITLAQTVHRLSAENAKLHDCLSFRRFEHVLRKHGLIDPAALDDPEGFDNYRTHGAVRSAHCELTSS